MELVVRDLFDFTIVEVEVGKWSYLIALLATADVPNRQLSVVAACQQLALLVWVPLQRIPLGLMTGKDQRGLDADWLDAFGSSSKAYLVEEMDVPKGSASGDKIGTLGVVPYTIDLPVVLDLVLHHDLVCHTLVILADRLRGTQRAVLELSFQGCLVGQIHLRHDEGVLLLAGSMRAVEEMAETVFIVGV